MKKIYAVLNIQKLVFLLDDFHFNEFANYLERHQARLPLKLIKVIRARLPQFDSHEALCKAVYGNYNKSSRQSFNQLASYTFKLSGHLSLNYPSYLVHNYSLVQRFVNQGEMEKANFLAKNLLEVAQRIEDYQTQIYTTKYFLQQAYLYKDLTAGSKLAAQLDEVYQTEKLYTDTVADLRNSLNVKLSDDHTWAKLATYKAKYREMSKSPYATIRMIGRYSFLYVVYYFETDKLGDREVLDTITDLEHDLDNFSFVVFPFMFDIKSNSIFLKLNSVAIDVASKEGKKQLHDLEVHCQNVQFWRNFLCMPVIFSTTAKASHYLSKYHRHLHKPDYLKIISESDLADIKAQCAICENILNQKAGHEDHHKNDLINIQLLLGGLLILSGGNNIRLGIAELESLLITYQQVNLSGTVDSIFICLMSGYFAEKKYEKCMDTFKRYLKVIKGKPLYEDNDIGIHTYYYLAQWLDNHRQQYLLKLKANYLRAKKNGLFDEPARTIEEFVEYFQLPISL